MSSSYRINETENYHREVMNTLGWELTVCNSLEEANSPCRDILINPGTLGNLVYDHLGTQIDLDGVESLVEIGGGYGYLMRDFQARRPWKSAAMVDLSPALMARQRETLGERGISFIKEDFFTIDPEFFRQFDLAVLNEVVGDFPTVCDIDPGVLDLSREGLDPVLREVNTIFNSYGLPVPGMRFNLNIGAIRAVERLCDAGLRHIYLSEHSCEASVPENMRGRLEIASTGNPERIPLMGHDEYTVRFSDLVAVAEKKGYRAIRGSYSDFIKYEYSARLHFILTSGSQRDEHEIIRQFVEDLHTYEYLVLTRE